MQDGWQGIYNRLVYAPNLKDGSEENPEKMSEKKVQILLVNDDGINSPGLWAAAEALAALGYVTVAAPREQASGSGRSFPSHSDGKINIEKLTVRDQEWETYAVGGTPAQVVQHALLEIMTEPPDLVVSGINYGENLGESVGISGTVGAAMEAASQGIPAIAASLQLRDERMTHSYSREIDFSTAAYFTAFFARQILEKHLPKDVDVLKIDVPYDATPQTDWRITRLGRHRYYLPKLERSGDWKDPGFISGKRAVIQPGDVPNDTDIYVINIEKKVSVTPLSLDTTSRVRFDDFDQFLRGTKI